MAKKKLNTRFAAAAVVTSIVLGGGGVLAYKYLFLQVRPAQRKAEGRAAMDRGEYLEAVNAFAGMGTRLAGDIEFITWFYESQLHLTSFDEGAYAQARSRLDAITNVDPKNVFALNEKLRLDLELIDRESLGYAIGQYGQRLADVASRTLEIEPANRRALRARAVTRVAPLFDPAAVPTSADVVAVRDAIAADLDGPAPLDPDLTLRYLQATMKLRDALVRERAIASDNDPRALELATDVEQRILALVAGLPPAPTTAPAAAVAVAATTRPAGDAALAAYRAYQCGAIQLGGRLAPAGAKPADLNTRGAEWLARAVELSTPADAEVYQPSRLAYAGLLAATDRVADAERVLRELVAGLPLQWSPRIALANFLSERGRPAEAVELMSADLKPTSKLVGYDGVAFARDAQAILLQRALFRLQTVATLPADQRDAAITLAETDYKTATGRGGETDARALQVKAALQEVRQDRTGAIQTLTLALNANPNEQLRQRIMEQLVNLNLALNQTGAAAQVLDQMRARNPSPVVLVRLIELNLRNGRPDAARTLLEEAKQRLPAGNPAIAALELRLMRSPEERRAALARLSAETPQLAILKAKLAAETGDAQLARTVAQEAVARFPDSVEVKASYAELLLRLGDRETAVGVLEELKKLRPDDKTITYLLDSARATTTEQRKEIAEDFVEKNVTDPYRRALVDAERARVANDDAAYLAKLLEADKLDTNKDGTAAERLYLYSLSQQKIEDAERYVDAVAASRKDPSVARVARARLALARGNFEAAQRQAEAIIADLPGFAGGYQVKGLSLAARGQFAEAVKAYDAAIAAEPGNLDVLKVAIESADKAGQRDTVKRYLDQGVALAQNDPFFVDWSLRYEAAYGDPVKTVGPRERLRDANAGVPQPWLALVDAYAAASRSRAAANDDAGAADYRKKAIATAREGATKFPATPQFPLAAAQLAAQGGDRAAADAIIRDLAADPKLGADPQVIVAIGNYYFEGRDAAAALENYRKAIETGRAGDDVKLRVAQILGSNGDVEGALRTLDGAGDTAPARELRVNLLFAANRADDAKAYAEAALAKERSTSNLLLAAIVASRRDDLAAARKYADDAVALEPENSAARYARARLALASPGGATNDAVIADLQVVRRTNPANADARLLLADRLDAAGRADEARAEIESLNRDLPGNANVALRLVQRLLADRPVPTRRIDAAIAEAKRQSPDNVQLLTLESNVLLERGDNAGAIAAARAASAAAGAQDAGAFRRMLSTMIRAGAPDQAIAELDARKADLDSTYWAHLTRGVALRRAKQDAASGPAFDRALELASSMVDEGAVDEVVNTYAAEHDVDATAAWLTAKVPAGPRQRALLLQAYLAGKANDKAMAAGAGLLAEVDQLSPRLRLATIGNLGVAALAVQPPRAAEARAAFERLIAIAPDDAMALNNLAYAMTLEGSGATPQQAVEIAKRAYEKVAGQGGTAQAYIGDTYGWTLVLSGDVDRGLDVLRQARQAEALPEIDLHIAEAQIRLKQGPQAVETVQTALANVEKLKQNRRVNDLTIVDRLNDALKRAQALQ